MYKKSVNDGYSEVIVVRKLLEQIRAYFAYLKCPFFAEELNERRLLLGLVEPSEERYKLLEWMMARLEPDIDFFFQRIYHSNEEVLTAKENDSIDAISYLKNIGLCYSRVMVPDIIHAKVSPLIQLKFLVRFLRCIRIKSWNRKPVLKKIDISKTEIEKSSTDENEIKSFDNNHKFNKNVSSEEISHFINEKILKRRRAKIIFEVLEHQLNADEIITLRETLYNNLKEKFEKNINEISSENVIQFSKLPFLDGVGKLLLNEIYYAENIDEISCSSIMPSESYSTLTQINETNDSICTSEFLGDVINLYNNLLKDNDVDDVVDKKQNVDRIKKDFSLHSQMNCNGDECPRPKPRIS